MSSIFGRAVAGAGGAAANIASRYIDEEISNNRLSLIADLRHQGMVRDDQHMNSPERQALLNKNAAGAVAARAEAERGAVTAGADDPKYQGALDRDAAAKATRTIASKNAELTGTAEAEAKRGTILAKAKGEADRDAAKDAAKDTDYIKAQGTLALADPQIAARIAASKAAASAAYANAGVNNAQAEGIRLNNADKKKLDGLYDEASKTLSDATIDDVERGKRFNKVQQQITLIKSKTGQAAGKASDPGTEETEATYNADGKLLDRKVTTKKPLPRGGDSAPAAPYPDGQELRGKDGQLYVVQGGIPVLKTKPAQAKTLPPPAAPDTAMQAIGTETLRQWARDRQAPEYQRANAELRRREGPQSTAVDDVQFPN